MFDRPESLVTGGLFLGFLAAFWARLKELALRVVGLLVLRVRLEGEIAQAVNYVLWKTGRCRSSGERKFASDNLFVRPVARNQVVGFEDVGEEPLIFWLGWKPVLVGLGKSDSSGFGVKLTTFRGLLDLDAFLVHCLDLYNRAQHEGESSHGRYTVKRGAFAGRGGFREGKGSYSDQEEVKSASGMPAQVSDASARLDRRYLKWDRSQLGAGAGDEDPFGALAFPPEVAELAASAERWLLSEKWYAEKRIPWRMGWLLYGRPGTGKTSLVKAIGQQLDLPVVVFDLSSYSNRGFVKAWTVMQNFAPCIALIEDVDGAFRGRVNRLAENGDGGDYLTFDCLLNCISGVQESNGVLMIMTTNKVEDLDDALGRPTGEGTMSTRPGRIDRVLELGPLNEGNRRQIAYRILADCSWLVDEQVQKGDGDTGAQFQERCSRVALDHYWSDRGGRRVEPKALGVHLGNGHA